MKISERTSVGEMTCTKCSDHRDRAKEVEANVGCIESSGDDEDFVGETSWRIGS